MMSQEELDEVMIELIQDPCKSCSGDIEECLDCSIPEEDTNE